MATGDLITLQEAKDHLGIKTNSSDDVIGRLITANSAFVNNLVNNPISLTQYDETQDGNGKDFLILRHYPVTAITGLWVSGREVLPATGNGKTVPWRNGYTLSVFEGSHQRITYHDGFFPRNRSAVSVSYTAGYADIPFDIKQAVWNLVGERFKYMDRIGYSSKSLGGQETVSFTPSRIDDFTKQLLQPYTRVVPV